MADIAEMDTVAKSRLRLWLRLLKLSRHVEGELRENLRQNFNTTLPRFDVMAALERFPDGLKMSELSGVLMVSNGNVTGIIDRLVSDGSVERIPVPGDRRASRVRLTAKGADDFARQAVKHSAWIDRIFEGIDDETAISTIDMLEKVNISDKDKG
jgi:DNA-binding MarR family transcriptional regulator